MSQEYDDEEYPVVPDYCECGQHVDEHDDELHAMKLDAAIARGGYSDYLEPEV